MKEKKRKKIELKTWHLLMSLTDSGDNTPYVIKIGFTRFIIEKR